MKPTLVVMAAGVGSRYGGLKQIDPVGPSGEIIIDYSVYDAILAGFGKVVFIIRRDIEQDFKSAIGSHFEGRIPVEYVFQELNKLPAGFQPPADRTKPWGTGHAILCCKDKVKEPFAVINADDFYGQESYAIISRHLSELSASSTDYCMVGYAIRNTLSDHGSVTRGICELDSRGNLKSVVERFKIEKTAAGARFADERGVWQPLTGDEIASMNMFGFSPAVFRELERMFPEFLSANMRNLKSEFLLPSLADRMIKDGLCALKVLRTSERWFGVTYKEDKPEVIANVRKLVDAGKYPRKLWT
ncbi:MAG: nucleotidyltransferase [Lentisphaerae bacterium]|nr:nucleotidyltransferase [Lentisphaerota bacterium]